MEDRVPVEPFVGQSDEGLTWRLAQAAAAVDMTTRKDTDDSADYETAANGAKLNKQERSALEDVLNQINLGPKTKS